jgi:solute carrier family 25 phosphate transporter 23/24/25/41
MGVDEASRASAGREGTQPTDEARPLPTSAAERGLADRLSEILDGYILEPLLRTHAGRVLLAGGVAGLVSRTVVAPLERTKILFQVQGLSISPPGQPARYRTVSQSLTSILQKEGIRGWFKGNGANCIRIIPMSALQFYAFDVLKREIQTREGTDSLTPLQRLWAGAAAGAFAQTLTYPLDFMRARLTVDMQGRYRGIFSGMWMVARAEGVGALYRGLFPSIVGIMPYVGVDFMVYGTLRDLLPVNAETGQPSTVPKLIAGAIAGAAGQTVAYPLDTVRCVRARARPWASARSARGVRGGVPGWRTGAQSQARGAPSWLTLPDLRAPPLPSPGPRPFLGPCSRRQLQVQDVKVKYPDVPKYHGLIDCFAGIVRREGVRGLYRGLWPNYLKVVPSISIQFVMFETACSFLEREQKQLQERRRLGMA